MNGRSEIAKTGSQASGDVSRPKRGETENDLLGLQEKFLQSRIAEPESPFSTTVTRLEKEAVASQMLSTGKRTQSEEDASVDTSGAGTKRARFGPSTPIEEGVVLADIVERDIRHSMVVAPSLPSTVQFFPPVFRRDSGELSEFKKKRRSIFAQQMSKMKESNSQLNVMPDTKLSSTGQRHALPPAGSSVIVDGSGLDSANKDAVTREIHQENLHKLSQMSTEEIYVEQRKLKESLDPAIVEFLMSRRRAKASTVPGRSQDGAMDVEVNSCHSVYQTNVAMDVSQEEVRSGATECKLSNDELPIPSSESARWLHMDKVENDKLLWTTSLPEPKPVDPKTGYVARFDFEGSLISRSNDVPVYQGLHHHGEEPEVAGYSLDELFTYSRSSVLQQKVLGLNTLARILAKNHAGLNDGCLNDPLLPQLSDAGLVLLIRWALDDNGSASLVASVAILHSLLVCPADEVWLDKTFVWHRGENMPYLQPITRTAELRQNDQVDERELTDAELLKLDVIKGLIRMDILPRLSYILEVLKPPKTVVVQVLEVLIRFGRHSLQTATMVARHPRLISTIVKEFLPTSWKCSESTTGGTRAASAYGFPLCQAAKLLRVLSSCGRHLATEIFTRHDVTSSVIRYAMIDCEMEEAAELWPLSLEALRLWTVFLTYGHGTERFLSCYPLIVRRLELCQALTLNDVEVRRRTFDCDYASALINLIRCVVRLAVQDVRWMKEVLGLWPKLEFCFKKWLWESSRADEVTHSTQALLGATFSCVVTFYEMRKMHGNVVDVIQQIAEFFSSTVRPFLASRVVTQLVTQALNFSLLLYDERSGTDRDPSTLPTLGTLMWGGAINPVLREGTPFPLLGHVVHAYLHLKQLHPGLDDAFCARLLDSWCAAPYLDQIASSWPLSSSDRGLNWFSRYETDVVCHLLLLAAAGSSYALPYHEAAIVALLCLHGGEEHLASKLMTSVVFNEDFVSDLDEVEAAMDELRVDDERGCNAKPVVGSETRKRLQLLRETRVNLASVCTTYARCLEIRRWHASVREESLCRRFLLDPMPFESFFFLPIVVSFENADTVDDATRRTFARHCLQFVHLVDCRRSSLMARVRPEAQFTHLASVFLLGVDLFFDAGVRSYLQDSLARLAHRGILTRMRLDDRPVPGVASFYDFYDQLLEQFEAVSYGDRVFASFLVVPMQMRYPSRLRKSVWSEHVNCLRILGVRPSELVVPLAEFLYPPESDVEIVARYLCALLNGQVRPMWCPVLYLVAVHHVHALLCGERSLHSGDGVENLRNRLQSSKDTVVYQHVTEYSGPRQFASCLGLELQGDDA